MLKNPPVFSLVLISWSRAMAACIILFGSLMIGCTQPDASSAMTDRFGASVREEALGPFSMRGLGVVKASGSVWAAGSGTVSLVTFETESQERARIVASKYIADLKGYSVEDTPGDVGARIPGWTYAIQDAGTWIVGLEGDRVHVLSGDDTDSLSQACDILGVDQWEQPQTDLHPKYLDNFDNKAVSMWWEPRTNPEEILDWAAERSAIINMTYNDNISLQSAPNATNISGWENLQAEAHLIDQEYRVMLYAMRAPKWWMRSVDMSDHFEASGDGVMTARSLFFSDLYQAAQSTSPDANAVMGAVLYDIMDALEDEDTMAWKVPPGEWNLKDPAWVPPNSHESYITYLQEKKNYTLAEANAAHGVEADSWDEFPYPETARFFGRRGTYLDVDGDWHWRARLTREEGLDLGVEQPDFDDEGWLVAPHDSRRLGSIYELPGEEKGTAPLWGRTLVDVPSSLVESNERVYLYAMPYTERKGRPFFAWVNGQEVQGKELMGTHLNRCTYFDVTDLIQPGENSLAVYSKGGRIIGRVWLGLTPPEAYPYSDPGLSRQWLDWMNFLNDTKLATVEFWLKAIRAKDSERPIKIMTGWGFQSDGQDLYEKYGAYIQLTGEGSFYRPMHYKGYSRLRGLPTSSEGAGPASNPKQMHRKFGWMFWEGQDAHDYVFNISRDLYPRKWKTEWWEAHEPLLNTLGNTEFPFSDQLGLLRDIDQAWLYMDRGIWRWDLSRGLLPGLGITPVLVDGRDMDKGYAQDIPVLIDTATRVMSETRVRSILDYVREGGTFVASFDTGRNSEYESGVWPLATELGLKITEKSVDLDDARQSPVLPLTFLEDQNLMPSLRGKTIEGMGISIDHVGGENTGAVSIHATGESRARPIAVWEDGSMAVCEVSYGKGKILWVGTPFYFRGRDVNGKWINGAEQQRLLAEFLTGLGITFETSVDDERMWISRRESKNGLYDVYFAAPMTNLGNDWNVDDVIVASFTVHNFPEGRDKAFEMTLAGNPEVEGVRVNEGRDVRFEDLSFHPYLVRQLAVVRDHVGLEGPLHWLQMQSRTWRSLDLPESLSTMREDLIARAHEIAEELGQDGMSLTDDWKVRKLEGDVIADGWESPEYDASDWENGRLGTWLANGWTDLDAAQYRKGVDIPSNWLKPNHRVLLGFSDIHRNKSQTGIQDRGRLWLNGELLKKELSGSSPFIFDVTDTVSSGHLDLALEVEGEPWTGGPGGLFYLWSLPRPAETISLQGSWRAATDWDREGGVVPIPGKIDPDVHNALGVRYRFELPQGWENKNVRLVIDQGKGGNADGVILNHRGYFREDLDILSSYGVRVDHWLQPGMNEIDIYNRGHANRKDFGQLDTTIIDVRLELYE